MTILAHVNNSRFMVQENNKYYLVTISEYKGNEIYIIDNPYSIYRQGYWEEFVGKPSEAIRKIIEELLNKEEV